MSMWDWDEQGESDERSQFRDPYASHSGGHADYSDHGHHHHNHAGHNHRHDQHHHMHGNEHSYHGQQSSRGSPSRQNYGSRHESYVDQGDRQNYGGRDLDEDNEGRQIYGYRNAHEHQGHDHDSNARPTHGAYDRLDHASSRPHTPTQTSRYQNQNREGYDTSSGYEIRQEHHSLPPTTGHEPTNETDLFTSDSVVNLTLDEIDALARTHRSRSWLVVLYAPWCRFCQAMEPNFERVAQHLEHSSVYVGRFRADGNYKEYAKRYLQLEHFPTILFFPKDSSNIVKYHSENREVDALLGFVQAFE